MAPRKRPAATVCLDGLLAKKSRRTASASESSFKRFWLVKHEPEDFSFSDLVKEGHTVWDGVRNAQASKNLGNMQIGDKVLYYHSGRGLKGVVGIAKITRAAYPDPTAKEQSRGWLAVDLAPVRALSKDVSLAALRANVKCASMPLMSQPRLSVMPVTADEYKEVLSMGGVGKSAEIF
eukprot:TRINITY_DN28024_c0_g1_i1.p1 TRINITY_DN28024_c0_g1~~TRINITY_DN28024_c0_g1_i1.p1  ORF type:complete len:178 (+),score=19.93 TRINITY_DN28024_c0_g1_i1:28-561(+)